MSSVDDPQLEILLACFEDHKRAGKSRRQLGRRINGGSGAVVDEVVLSVNHKGVVHTSDPRRVVAGTVTPAVTWGLFGLLASGGWSGLLIWGVVGAVCGGLYAYYTEHRATKNELKRLGRQLAHDSSALAVYVHGATGKELLDDLAPEHPRLASVATVGSDLSATVVTAGAHEPVDVHAAPPSAPPNGDALLNMLMFRYRGADEAKRVDASASADQAKTKKTKQAKTKQAAVQTELLLRADKSGRIHVVSPGTGVRAFVPGDAIGWGLFGLVFGGIAGLAGGGGVLGFAEHAAVTGILWALFGVVAGTLYALWAGRSISARRMKALRPLLPPDTSIALCWVEGAVSYDSIAEWSTPATEQLVMRFRPMDGGAVLEV